MFVLVSTLNSMDYGWFSHYSFYTKRLFRMRQCEGSGWIDALILGKHLLIINLPLILKHDLDTSKATILSHWRYTTTFIGDLRLIFFIIINNFFFFLKKGLIKTLEHLQEVTIYYLVLLILLSKIFFY